MIELIIIVAFVLGVAYLAKKDSDFASILGPVVAVVWLVLYLLFCLACFVAAAVGAIAAATTHEPMWLTLAIPLAGLLIWCSTLPPVPSQPPAPDERKGPWA